MIATLGTRASEMLEITHAESTQSYYSSSITTVVVLLYNSSTVSCCVEICFVVRTLLCCLYG